ncbi:MAG: hypothetical protein HYS12_29950 [Planctomycetes bacterium]|nr:hypothetical protein [Planctomycetota bacterium]
MAAFFAFPSTAFCLIGFVGVIAGPIAKKEAFEAVLLALACAAGGFAWMLGLQIMGFIWGAIWGPILGPLFRNKE